MALHDDHVPREHVGRDAHETPEAPARRPRDAPPRPARDDLASRTFGHWRPGPASAWRLATPAVPEPDDPRGP